MLGPITGPSLGCVLKLGYRRPLDDTAFLGEIEWDEVSDPGAGEDCAVITGKKGKNKRKGRDFFGNNAGPRLRREGFMGFKKIIGKKNEKQFSNKIDLGKKGPKNQLVDEDKSPSVSCKKNASHSRVKGRIVR